MDPTVEGNLIALGIQSLENLFDYLAQRKKAAGLSDQDLLAAAAQFNDQAVQRTQAFLNKLNGVAAA